MCVTNWKYYQYGIVTMFDGNMKVRLDV